MTADFNVIGTSLDASSWRYSLYIRPTAVQDGQFEQQTVTHNA